MSFDFKGKKYLVTGAGQGIGRAIALKLAKHGSKVYALSRSKEPLDSLVAEHPGIHPIVADIGNWEEIREKLADIEALDGLVNNAAVMSMENIPGLEWSREILQKSFNTNVLGSINVIQMVGKKMVETGRSGSIVNISSITSLQALPSKLPYCVSKAGLDMVTKQFALELGSNNIRVNSVNPTLVATERVNQAIKSGSPFAKVFTSRTPMKRLAEVDEIVSPVLYFLSDMSSMVSGTIHVVDGGAMASFVTDI
ncbi:L-xylulose reductase-like [Mercenaria mercenaria]|uniref:L-xylulose reductase-like n=1 Tax=Mercenaria mercenaria TaxID=6596 RepID=UPI00234E8C5F|nr:L-xylulose reductase-like [Mercenaria mercenaria]